MRDELVRVSELLMPSSSYIILKVLQFIVNIDNFTPMYYSYSYVLFELFSYLMHLEKEEKIFSKLMI